MALPRNATSDFAQLAWVSPPSAVAEPHIFRTPMPPLVLCLSPSHPAMLPTCRFQTWQAVLCHLCPCIVNDRNARPCAPRRSSTATGLAASLDPRRSCRLSCCTALAAVTNGKSEADAKSGLKIGPACPRVASFMHHLGCQFQHAEAVSEVARRSNRTRFACAGSEDGQRPS